MTVHSFGRHLVLLFVAAFLPGVCASTKTIRVAVPSEQMTVRQARKTLIETLGQLSGFAEGLSMVRDVKVRRDRVTFTADVGRKSQIHCVLPFSEMNNLMLKSWESSLKYYQSWHEVLADGKPPLPAAGEILFKEKSTALAFINAVLILKQTALTPEREEADFREFSDRAGIWQLAQPKPAMSDEARAFKALAEDAFKRKDFAAALAAYCDALDKHPMWPEGHYNAALLAAETGDYELAAHHMRRYLVLAPNAKDATAAKDKFLFWQLKAKE